MAIAVVAVPIILSVAMSNGFFSNTFAEETVEYALIDRGSNVFTAELAHPLGFLF